MKHHKTNTETPPIN